MNRLQLGRALLEGRLQSRTQKTSAWQISHAYPGLRDVAAVRLLTQGSGCGRHRLLRRHPGLDACSSVRPDAAWPFSMPPRVDLIQDQDFRSIAAQVSRAFGSQDFTTTTRKAPVQHGYLLDIGTVQGIADAPRIGRELYSTSA